MSSDSETQKKRSRIAISPTRDERKRLSKQAKEFLKLHNEKVEKVEAKKVVEQELQEDTEVVKEIMNALGMTKFRHKDQDDENAAVKVRRIPKGSKKVTMKMIHYSVSKVLGEDKIPILKEKVKAYRKKKRKQAKIEKKVALVETKPKNKKKKTEKTDDEADIQLRKKVKKMIEKVTKENSES